MAGELAQATQDVQTITPYLWEIVSFFGVLGVLRVTQWIKGFRKFPLWMCNIKVSKVGNHQYKKIKKKYLIGFATFASFGIITLCLMQAHEDLKQVMLIAGVAALSQFTIVELIFSYIGRKNPDAASVLSNGLYVPEDEKTVMTTVKTLIVGGGVDKRE